MNKVVLFMQKMNAPHEFFKIIETVHLANSSAAVACFVQQFF